MTIRDVPRQGLVCLLVCLLICLLIWVALDGESADFAAASVPDMT
jgi:hypothetical protein